MKSNHNSEHLWDKILTRLSAFSHAILAILVVYQIITHYADIYDIVVRPSTNVIFKYLQITFFIVITITIILVFFIGATSLYKEISKRKPHSFIDNIDTKIRDISFRKYAIPVIFISVVGSVISTIINVNLDKREWVLAVSWANAKHPDTFPSTMREDLESFKKDVDISTNHKIKIIWNESAAEKPDLLFDKLEKGEIQMLSSAQYYFPKSDSTGRMGDFFSSIPFGKEFEEYDDWIKNGGGQAIWDSICIDLKVKPFPFGHTGQQPAGWFVKEYTLENMKTLSMRIPPLPGKVIQKLGASFTPIHPDLIKSAIENKELNGFEWIGTYEDMVMQYQTTKDIHFYYRKGWHEEDAMLSMYVNREYYDRLDSDTKAILEQIIAKYSLKISLKMAKRNEWAWQYLKQNKVNNISYREDIPKDLKDELFNKWLEVLKEKCSHKGFKSVFLSYLRHRIDWKKKSGFHHVQTEYDFSRPENLSKIGITL